MHSMLFCCGLNPVCRLGHGKDLDSRRAYEIQKYNIKQCIFLNSHVTQRYKWMILPGTYTQGNLLQGQWCNWRNYQYWLKTFNFYDEKHVATINVIDCFDIFKTLTLNKWTKFIQAKTKLHLEDKDHDIELKYLNWTRFFKA